ncbi:MAG TPA: YbjN domain-containing protein [Allocoleopsis sp.]
MNEAIEEATSAFDELIDTLAEAVDELSDTTLYATVIDFFTEDDWSFTKVQGEPILHMAFQSENGTYSCCAKIRENEEQFVFYSICPLVIPEAKRGAIAEFITRANYGMIIGNFEMDFEDGEIRYKTSIGCN